MDIALVGVEAALDRLLEQAQAGVQTHRTGDMEGVPSR